MLSHVVASLLCGPFFLASCFCVPFVLTLFVSLSLSRSLCLTLFLSLPPSLAHSLTRSQINALKFERFIGTIEKGYLATPYHNSLHAADVVQAVHYFLTQGREKDMVRAPRLLFHPT